MDQLPLVRKSPTFDVHRPAAMLEVASTIQVRRDVRVLTEFVGNSSFLMGLGKFLVEAT
jgi:hypothetical protein